MWSRRREDDSKTTGSPLRQRRELMRASLAWAAGGWLVHAFCPTDGLCPAITSQSVAADAGGGTFAASAVTTPAALPIRSRQLMLPPISSRPESSRALASIREGAAGRVLPPASRVLVTAIAAAPGGGRIAVAGDDFAVRLVDVASLTVTSTLPGHRDLVRSIAFSPNGRYLATSGNDGRLLIRDLSADDEIVQRLDDMPAIARLTFTPAGDALLMAGFDRRLIRVALTNAVAIPATPIRETTPGRTGIRRFPAADVCELPCNDLRAIAFLGPQVLTGGRDGQIYSLGKDFACATGVADAHRGRIRDMKVLGDGRRVVSVAEDGHVVVTDVPGRQIRARYPIRGCRLFAVEPLRTGAIPRRPPRTTDFVAIAGSDNLIRVVDLRDGAVTESLRGHDGSVASLVSSGRWLFSGGFDGVLHRWAVDDLLRGGERIAVTDATSGTSR